MIKNVVFLVLAFLTIQTFASELEDSQLYGGLLYKEIESKADVKLKKLDKYKQIKSYLKGNKCKGFKYRAYVVGEEDGEFLYLVASKRKNVIIGRHFKAPILNGEVQVEDFESSTNGCLDLGAPKKDIAALTATHLKPYPNEFHVLQSKLSGIALYIGTKAGVYAIENGQIRLVKSK